MNDAHMQILFVLTECVACDKDHPDAEYDNNGGYRRFIDSWTACSDMHDAEIMYEAAINSPNTYIANIAVCIRSTDYDTGPGCIDYTYEKAGYRTTIQKTHTTQ